MTMTTRSLLAAAAAVVLCAAPVFAQGPPQPAAEMSQLKVFDGNWTCEGTAHPTPFGPGGKMTGSVSSKTDLGGFWQSGTVKGTMANFPPFEGMYHMTWEPGAKQFVMLWADNMGGFAKSMSKGWEGDKLIFAGDGTMAGKTLPARDTFIKNADGSLRHTWEMQVDGKWTPAGDETCKKAK
jgi:hypothetical protein